jgi:DNA-directed RNA polymerase specialized sigma54-like protein
MYKYIRIEPVTASLDEITNINSAYSEGVTREKALAESAPYLAERVKYLEWLISELRQDNETLDK